MIMSLTSRRVVALLALLTSCLFLLAITILKQYILILWIIGTLVICLALVIAVREQNMGIRRVLLLNASRESLRGCGKIGKRVGKIEGKKRRHDSSHYITPVSCRGK